MAINKVLSEIKPLFIYVNLVECIVYISLSIYVVSKIRMYISNRNLFLIVLFNAVFVLKCCLYIIQKHEFSPGNQVIDLKQIGS